MRFVHVDPNSDIIMGWIDTEAFTYAELPSTDHLGMVSDEDWDKYQAAWAAGKSVWWDAQNKKVVDVKPAQHKTIEQAKADKLREMDAACAKAIVSGFSCNALGKYYVYPSKLTDQQNLNAVTTASTLPRNASNPNWSTQFWCQDILTNEWSWRKHSAEQIQTVGDAGFQAILGYQGYNALLAAKIAAAANVAAVEEISWQLGTYFAQVPGQAALDEVQAAMELAAAQEAIAQAQRIAAEADSAE